MAKTKKYNWIILLFAAVIIAIIAALGFLQWKNAVLPIGAFVIASAVTWLLLRRQHEDSA